MAFSESAPRLTDGTGSAITPTTRVRGNQVGSPSTTDTLNRARAAIYNGLTISGRSGTCARTTPPANPGSW